MRYTLRFFLSWIIAAVFMYVAFYVWHGVVLNDFKQIQFPIVWFVVLSAFAYLVISFLLFRVFETKIISYFDNIFMRGFISALIVSVSLISGNGIIPILSLCYLNLINDFSYSSKYFHKFLDILLFIFLKFSMQ